MELTRDNTFSTPDVSKNDMLGSGVSVLSQEHHNSEEIKDQDLSDSVQAELHLSLDRLSENFDPEELKRLQEKSKTHREKLSSVRDGPGKTPDSKQSKARDTVDKDVSKLGGIFDCVCKAPLTGDAEEMKQKDINAISQDSLDTDTNTKFQSETEISGESDQGDDEDTLVGDSLDYTTGRDSLTPASKDKIKNRNIPTPAQSQEPSVDKYADLRYNPNWVKRTPIVKPAPPVPAMVDLTKGHDLRNLEADSLDEESSPKKRVIVIPNRDLGPPLSGGSHPDEFHFVSSRSISPTRLSVDPVKLKQTNELYEAEFHKLMKAETDERRVAGQERQNRGIAEISGDVRQRANDGILIRRIDSDLRSPESGTQPLLGGYVALPDRHVIPSPDHNQRIVSEDVIVGLYHDSSNTNSGRRRIRQPEGFVTDNKKDPLNALSPRTRTRPVGPTPPRAPKPKYHKDYIEINKQRISRKTNSAGYLELHHKRFRQNEQPKSRSYSELRKTSENAARSPQRGDKLEEVTGSIEDIWQQKTERLRIAKGENLNKGKIIRPPKARAHETIQGSTFLVSPRTQVNWNRMHVDANSQFPTEDQIKFINQDNLDKPGGLFSRLHQRNNREVFYEASHHNRALPLPSQQHFFNLHQNGEVISQEELAESLREEQMRRAIIYEQFAQQQSPLMKAYHAQYGHEPVQRQRSLDEQKVQQYFSEQNLSLPPSQRSHQPEIWVSTALQQGFLSNLTPSQPSSNGKHAGRKVTFMADKDTVFVAEDARLYQVPVTNSRGNQGFGKSKIPLPPTPLNKSHNREAHQVQYELLPGKENISLEDYYDVRQGTYPILPPILKTQPKSPLKSSPVANEKPADEEKKGSYLEAHEKQKRKRQYKIYTLTDYKNLKKDVKLGGLGPDLESVKDKTEKQERARKYAEFIRNQHKSNAVVKESTDEATLESESSFHNVNHHFSTRTDDKLRQELSEKRKRAIDYSKKVPRPKLKPKPSYQVPQPDSFFESPLSNRVSDDSLNTSPRGLEMTPDDADLNWSLLQVLKERHEREKAQVAAFAGNN